MTEEQQKPQRKWYQKKRFIIPLVIFVLFILGGIVNSGNPQTTQTTTAQADSDNQRESQNQEEPTQPPQAEVVDLQAFITEFDDNQLAAEDKYEGKLVELTGYVNNISEDIIGKYFITLKPTAEEFDFSTTTQCYFEDKSAITSIKNGDQVTVQGVVKTQSIGSIMVEKCQLK